MAEGKRVAFLVAAEGTEQVELTEPWKAVKQAGSDPVLVSPERDRIQAFHDLDRGETFEVDMTVGNARVEDFDVLVLPGGVINGDLLRTDEQAVSYVRAFTESGKLVAAICHGPWTLVEADVVRGRTMTSWPSLRTDLTNAGARWVDQEVVICEQGPGPLITSRKPDDIPAFNQALLDRL